MLSMTVVMALVARRKTCFPAAGCVIATKAEPSEDAKAFCVSSFGAVCPIYIKGGVVNMIQKVLFLFRALSYASARGGRYSREHALGNICHHPPPRPPDGRLKRNKIKKPPLAVKKVRLFAGTKRDFIIYPIVMLGVNINKSSYAYSLIHKP